MTLAQHRPAPPGGRLPRSRRGRPPWRLGLLVWLLVAGLADTARAQAPGPAAPQALALGTGEHLFLDDYLIAQRHNVQRVINQPRRTRPGPVVPGLTYAENGSFDFDVTVLYQLGAHRWRMWYKTYDPANLKFLTAHLESTDGINWPWPPQVLTEPNGFIIQNVVDRGAQAGPGQARYWSVVPSQEQPPPRWQGELWVSPDGLAWQAADQNPVTLEAYGEVWRLFTDPRTGDFGLLHRWNKPYTWTDAEGRSHRNTEHDPTFTRLIALATGPTLDELSPSRVVFAPNQLDSGETQFYGTSNVIQRGEYLITMLLVLRDDLKASGTPETIYFPYRQQDYAVYGIGYTVLAWSRDGQAWFRDRAPNTFFEPHPDPNAWDHAHAWITSIVPVRDALYLYYGGYQLGHKTYVDRQIGQVALKRDRFVAQQAGAQGGRLRTQLMTFYAGRLTLNVNAAGRVRVQVEDAAGHVVPGFAFEDCAAISGDRLDAEVRCGRPWSSLRGQPIQLVFDLRDARLFAFSIVPERQRQ